MFTGIITDIGTVREITHSTDAALTITTHYDTKSIALGASIACSGICLTVVETGSDWFRVHASAETLAVTTLAEWQEGTRVNLERALKAGDELGGHFVSGHVDAVGTLTSITPVGKSFHLRVQAPKKLLPFIAAKGSIAVDGISLTINAVEDEIFTLMIIPHTWQHTTLSSCQTGDAVNLEIDPIARYAARMLEVAYPNVR